MNTRNQLLLRLTSFLFSAFCFAVFPVVLGEILISVTETHEGVLVEGVGSVDTKGLGGYQDDFVSDSDFSFFRRSGMVRVGNHRTVQVRVYHGIRGPREFGSNQQGREAIGTGDNFGVLSLRGALILPLNYESNAPLAGTTIYPGIGLKDLGLEVGLYVWDWGNREQGDRVTVQVASDLAVPKLNRPFNLLQGGSFENENQYWMASAPLQPRIGDAAHGDQFVDLTGYRFLEQQVNLFPGRYQLIFAFASPDGFRNLDFLLEVEEQGISFPAMVSTQFRVAGVDEGAAWRYRAAEFDVVERVGDDFQEIVLRFRRGNLVPRDDENSDPELSNIWIDDVHLYSLGESDMPLVYVLPGQSRRENIAFEVSRPGRIFLELSENLVDWSPLLDPIRVFGPTWEAPLEEGRELGVRFYRGRFDSFLHGDPNELEPTEAKIVWVEPGELTLGSPESDPDRDDDEVPLMQVTLTQRYGIGIHEVTQAEYYSLMGVNPSRFRFDDQLPVTNMRWQQAMEYCRRLTEREERLGRLPEGFIYRLPTEAQWDFACQAGKAARFHYGDDPDYQELGQYAWYAGNSEGVTHPVMTKEPNQWGIYGLHGNVHEWCFDRYGEYPGGETIDPTGAEGDDDRTLHVIRGGSFLEDAMNCRRSDRHRDWFEIYVGNVGFRVALVPEPEEVQVDFE